MTLMIPVKQQVSSEPISEEICVQEDEVAHSSQLQQGFFFFVSVFFCS